MPQLSVAVNVLVCDLVHVPLITPSKEVTVGVLQLSVAVALPSAASICAAVGLQPRFAPSATEPVAVITGAVVSAFQLMVRLVLLLLPHRSVELKVRVWLLMQSPLTAPSLAVTVLVPSQ